MLEADPQHRNVGKVGMSLGKCCRLVKLLPDPEHLSLVLELDHSQSGKLRKKLIYKVFKIGNIGFLLPDPSI